MPERNEIKDIVAELVQLRIAVLSLNPDPTKTIAQYQAEARDALEATKALALFTKALARATWAVFAAAVGTGLLILLQVLIALRVIAR